MFFLKKFKKPISVFNEEVLAYLASDDLSREYQTNAPYPHIVIDNLFNPVALNAVLREWPNTDDDTYESHNDGRYVKNKKGSSYKSGICSPAQLIIDQLCRPRFLETLEKLTGIGALVPDPYNFGGGIHETSLGGRLAVHVDYNKHFKYKLDRRLNFIVYLNKGWSSENGGMLELWDAEMKQKEKEVLPIFNKTVIFSTTSNSFHGHPVPVSGPSDIKRKSIALYYFSNGRPEENSDGFEHTTLWEPLKD